MQHKPLLKYIHCLLLFKNCYFIRQRTLVKCHIFRILNLENVAIHEKYFIWYIYWKSKICLTNVFLIKYQFKTWKKNSAKKYSHVQKKNTPKKFTQKRSDYTQNLQVKKRYTYIQNHLHNKDRKYKMRTGSILERATEKKLIFTRRKKKKIYV